MTAGTTVLGIVGAFGVVLLLLLSLIVMSDSNVPLWYWLLSISVFAWIAGGYALLVGYRRIQRGTMPSDRRSLHWWRSAAYNAVCSVLGALIVAWSLRPLVELWLATIGPEDVTRMGYLSEMGAWTVAPFAFSVWMVWASWQRAQQPPTASVPDVPIDAV